MNFLVDECVTTDLVTIAHENGHVAEHIVRIGKAGWMDWSIVRYAYDGDFAFITNNAKDFLRLYAEESLHAGLIIFIPNVPKEEQVHLFRKTLEELNIKGEPINQVLEVDFDGEEVVFTTYDLFRTDG